MTLEEALAQIEAMKTKNAEILDEKKKGDKALKDLSDKVADLTKERDDTKEAAEAEAAKKAGDWAKLETQLKEKHAKELKERDDKIVALEAARDSLVLDGGLTDAMAAAGVAEQFRPAVKALLRGRGAVVKIEGGEFVGYLGDKKLADAVKEFAGTDEGKHFVKTDSTGGGGKGGKGGSSSAENPYKKGSAHFNRTRQAELERDNPTLAAQLKAEAA